ncbi:MAG: ferritin family protein [Euryarchaeota archaeon]|nr:ferritin family protein [Euryarchaeota archaeon]
MSSALSVEKFGIEFYRRFSECVSDENGAALLRGLGRDEETHREQVEREMRRMAPDVEPGSVAPARTLLGIVPENAFPFPPDRCMTLEDEIKALEVGIQVEISSSKMYRGAALIVEEPGTRKLLESLADIEEGHRKLLEDSMRMLRDQGAWYGYSPILEG